MQCPSSEQDARLAARSERLRATGPIWWLWSSGALTKLLTSIEREPLRYRSAADRPRVSGVHTSDDSAPAAALDSAALALTRRALSAARDANRGKRDSREKGAHGIARKEKREVCLGPASPQAVRKRWWWWGFQGARSSEPVCCKERYRACAS